VLSDTERRRLAEIELWFETNDPRLARRFAGRRAPVPGPAWLLRRRWAVVLLVALGVAVAVGAGIATRDVPAGIVGAIAVLTVAAGCWWVRWSARRWSTPTPPADPLR
jgi:Flp pilus assembly protein TadB